MQKRADTTNDIGFFKWAISIFAKLVFVFLKKILAADLPKAYYSRSDIGCRDQFDPSVCQADTILPAATRYLFHYNAIHINFLHLLKSLTTEQSVKNSYTIDELAGMDRIFIFI
jgi:hypothetical protein